MKIEGYNTYNKNSSNEVNDGSAILVKRSIKYKVTDSFIMDVFEITIESTLGPVSIARTYLPPRRPYLLLPDIHKLAHNNHPTYILGDFNATLSTGGRTRGNAVGRGLERFFNNGKLNHLGPDFSKFHTRNSCTTRDIFSSMIKQLTIQ